jgi:membrane-associated phospholipid phosphatase
MTRTFRAWLMGLAVTAALVTVSIQLIDKPIALYFLRTSKGYQIPAELAGRIFSIPLLAALVFIACGLAVIIGRRFSKLEATIAICTIGALATIVIKDQLKFVFGRTWPYLLRNDVYGFNFFRSGKSFESFPSGHAAIAAVVLTVLWVLFPNKRAFCVMGIVAVDIGLVALNLHFLSDVIAGSFLGVSTGLFTVGMWRAIEPLMSRTVDERGEVDVRGRGTTTAD